MIVSRLAVALTDKKIKEFKDCFGDSLKGNPEHIIIKKIIKQIFERRFNSDEVRLEYVISVDYTQTLGIQGEYFLYYTVIVYMIVNENDETSQSYVVTREVVIVTIDQSEINGYSYVILPEDDYWFRQLLKSSIV